MFDSLAPPPSPGRPYQFPPWLKYYEPSHFHFINEQLGSLACIIPSDKASLELGGYFPELAQEHLDFLDRESHEHSALERIDADWSAYLAHRREARMFNRSCFLQGESP